MKLAAPLNKYYTTIDVRQDQLLFLKIGQYSVRNCFYQDKSKDGLYKIKLYQRYYMFCFYLFFH